MRVPVRCMCCPNPATTILRGQPVCDDCSTISGAVFGSARRLGKTLKAKRDGRRNTRRPKWLKGWMRKRREGE